jgi:hypothetical protein
MRSLKSRYRAAWLVLGLAVVASAPVAQAEVVQPFQFSDDFYRSHGIDPSMTLDHFVFPDAKFPECASDPAAPRCRTRLGTSPDPAKYNDVRVVETTIGWRHNGNFLSYMAPSKLTPDSFMRDANGNLTAEAAHTKGVCESFRAFLFPKTNRETLAFVKNPGLPNRRQDNIFETQHGYWSNNPLGCWSLAFVVWNGPNLDGPVCQDALADLIDENGEDLDGTAIIQTLNDINSLTAKGCTTVNLRAFDGSEGFPWVV